MKPSHAWRRAALLLVLANGLFWLWSEGHLRPLGWGPQVVREPQRLQNQITPELLYVTSAK